MKKFHKIWYFSVNFWFFGLLCQTKCVPRQFLDVKTFFKMLKLTEPRCKSPNFGLTSKNICADRSSGMGTYVRSGRFFIKKNVLVASIHHVRWFKPLVRSAIRLFWTVKYVWKKICSGRKKWFKFKMWPNLGLLRFWICRRCHWHRWQIMGTISGCWHLKVNL